MTEAIKVVFVGLGKMGAAAARIANEDPEIKIVACVELKGSESMQYPIFTSEKFIDAIKDAEIMVDFTNADAATENILKAIAAGKKVVVGTTGFNEEQLNKINAAVKKYNAIVLLAPNFSVGVNLFFKFAGEMATKLRDYDVEVIEWHHNQKKDAPSGTAAKIVDIIKNARAQHDEIIYGRSGIAPRKKNEIGVHAIRAGDIVGTHSILFVGNNEEIEFRHCAHSRDAFARGCLQAIKWISAQNTQDKGGKIYGMNDVLGI
ncbi:MAG: 4-hydroxy-tetrahydrodipicolinate reductase [Candidatus Micrarchaeota archaeon]